MPTHPARAEGPYRQGGTNTRYQAKQECQRRKDREETAIRRFQMVKWLYDQGLQDESKARALAYLKDAVAEGQVTGPVPARRTLNRWMNWAEEAQRPFSIADFYDDRRTGRNRKEMDPLLEAYLEVQIDIGAYPSIAELHRWVQGKAEELGIEDPPSYYQVKTFEQSYDPAEVSAKRHGQQSAMADNANAQSVPTDHPWEVCTLDETRAPCFIRAWHAEKDRYVAVKPWVILMVDNHSNAIVSYRIVPPYRLGEGTMSYNGEDILGTVLSAALPEIAHDATHAYSGYLPQKLRWDRHGTHNEPGERLERVGVDVLEARGNRPWAQGAAEKIVSIVKSACYHIHGYDGKYLPATRTTEDPDEAVERMAANSTFRQKSKILVATRDLLSYEQFVEEFDEQVEKYNRRERDYRPSPRAQFFGDFDQEVPNAGRNALHALDHARLTVSNQGIRHRGETFTWKTGRGRLRVGEKVYVRPDPLLRGIWGEVNGEMLFLPPADEANRVDNHIEVVRNLERTTSRAADDGDETRREELRAIAGPRADLSCVPILVGLC